LNYLKHKEDLFIIWDIKQQINLLAHKSLNGYDDFRRVNDQISYLQMIIDGLIKIENDRLKQNNA